MYGMIKSINGTNTYENVIPNEYRPSKLVDLAAWSTTLGVGSNIAVSAGTLRIHIDGSISSIIPAASNLQPSLVTGFYEI